MIAHARFRRQQPAGVDRLSTLAPELLQRIFSLAYAKHKPTAPLSHSLRPFYDTVVFERVRASNSLRVQHLLKAVKARPALGIAVRSLKMTDGPTGSKLAIEDVQALLAALPKLQVVTIVAYNANMLEAVLPTRPGARTVIPQSVSWLSVHSRKSHGSGYEPTVLATVQQLPNLKSLILDITPGEIAGSPTTATTAVAFPNITMLGVTVPGEGQQGVTLDTADFVAHFPRLRKLWLTAHSSTHDIAATLSRVKNPRRITELRLNAPMPIGWRFPAELDAFKSLHTLVLEGNFEHVTIEGYVALSLVPLKVLKVGKKCDVSAAALKALLGPGGICPTLTTLQLDNHSAAYPPDIEREGFYLPDYADNSFDAEELLMKFDFPFWTSVFPASGYDELARVAQTHRVTLKGSTVTAREIDLEIKGIEEDLDEMKREEEEEEYGPDGLIDYEDGFRGYPGSNIRFRLNSWRNMDDDEEDPEADEDYY
ncbi:hypothetical protein JCM10908_000896 [Rhodotorula pacifica]|uniref:uncharacterized protein n=1 Tax=Rhodotorula pacifica TaxID=1495444 RepID=UPI00317AA85E